MSNKVSTSVWKHCKQKHDRRLVMVALADWCNDEGECWPGQNAIAEKTRLTLRGVRKIIDALSAEGEIKLLREGGGVPGNPKETARYELTKYIPKNEQNNAAKTGGNGDASSLETDQNRGERGNVEGGTGKQIGGNQETNRGECGSPKPSVEPSIETSIKPSPVPAGAGLGFVFNFLKNNSCPDLYHLPVAGQDNCDGTGINDANHSSPKKSKPEKKSSARKQTTPEQQTVMSAWNSNYELHNGRPYIETPFDLKAIDQLLTSLNPEKLADQMERAFMLKGNPDAWTCNKRMADLSTFAKEFNKIAQEVAQYKPSSAAYERLDTQRKRKTWTETLYSAVNTLHSRGLQKASPEFLVFMRGKENLDEVTPYCRCVLSEQDPDVMKTYGSAAAEEYEIDSSPSLKKWMIDEGVYVDFTDENQTVGEDESIREQHNLENPMPEAHFNALHSETSLGGSSAQESRTAPKRSMAELSKQFEDARASQPLKPAFPFRSQAPKFLSSFMPQPSALGPGPMPPIPTEWSLGDVDAPTLSAPPPTSACAGGMPEASRQPSSCGPGPMPPIPLQPSSVDPGKMPPIPPSH